MGVNEYVVKKRREKQKKRTKIENRKKHDCHRGIVSICFGGRDIFFSSCTCSEEFWAETALKKRVWL
jgi:hypothetical protein